MTRLWKACLTCASVGLIKLNNIIRNRARDVWIRSQKWKNRVRSTSERRNQSALRGWRVLSMERKRTVHTRKRLHFPPRWEETWKSNANVLFCSKTADSKRWGTCLMESLSEAGVRDRAKTTAVEKCTTSSCDSWHPPVCQNYKAESGCKFGEQSALLCTERLAVSQTNDRKRMVVKFLLPYWRSPGNWSLRIPGQRAAEIQFDFYGRTQNPWDRSAAWNFHKAHYATQKKWERKSPSQGITQQSEHHERNLYAQKFVDRTQQETLQTRTMRQQRRVGNGTRYSEAWRKGQSHTLLALRSLVSTSAINRLFCKYVSSIVTAGHAWWFLSSPATATTQRRSTSIPVLGNQLPDPTETQNTSENEDTVPARGKLVARFARVVRGAHRKSWRLRSVSIKAHTCKHFSWFWFGTSYKSGIEKAQYLNSLPKRPKLRSTQENQDCKGSLQETHWWCSTSCRNLWWFK